MADDVSQEALTRTLAVRPCLPAETFSPYAVATARNLITDLQRAADLERRHRHRLLEQAGSPLPDARLLAQEQHAAVRLALGSLKQTDRALLLSYEEGASTSELASGRGSTPAAIATRLSRIRARMRVDYILALRRTRLPTLRCRPVLLAVSAHDGRRQRAIGVDRHLASCSTCAQLVPPLIERSSRLAGIVLAPLLALGALGGRVARLVRAPLGQAAAVVSAAAVAGTCYAIVSAGSEHSTTATGASNTPARPALLRVVDGTALLPVPAARRLHDLIGKDVVADGVPVQSVVSHPGFWVGTSTGQRLYVRIIDPQHVVKRVQPGTRLHFTGRLVGNTPNLAGDEAVTPPEGASLLREQGVHIDIAAAALPR
jgi:RNA polymerase sigma factor (sigma-70 family)